MSKQKRDLTADDILGEGTRELAEFPLPQLGGVVYIREMSAAGVMEFEGAEADASEVSLRSLARSLCSKDGERLLSDDQATEFKDKIGIKTFMRLQEKVMELNELGGPRGDLSHEQVEAAMQTAGVADDRIATVLSLLPGGDSEKNE